MNITIPTRSLAFKKVAKALAKNKEMSLRRMFVKFATEEVKKYDVNEYDNPFLKTKKSYITIENMPQKLQREISVLAKLNGLSVNEFCRHLMILLVNSELPENKVYLEDSVECEN